MRSFSRWILGAAALLCLSVASDSKPLWAQQSIAVVAAASTSAAMAPEDALSPTALQTLSQAVRSILVEGIPERIEHNDDWGDTRERFSQLKLHTSGGKLRFETTTKPVKHGLWKQLVVAPVDPQQNLRFEIVELRSIGGKGLSFQVLVFAPLELTARVERWRTGVKLFNVSTDAEASVELRLTGEVRHDYQLRDGTKYLVFKPRVTAVEMRLAEFDIRRISQAAGPLVHELGDMLSDPLADQLEKHEPKIVEKLNKAIAKREEKLRIPVSFSINWDDWTWSNKKKSPEASLGK